MLLRRLAAQMTVRRPYEGPWRHSMLSCGYWSHYSVFLTINSACDFYALMLMSILYWCWTVGIVYTETKAMIGTPSPVPCKVLLHYILGGICDTNQ